MTDRLLSFTHYPGSDTNPALYAAGQPMMMTWPDFCSYISSPEVVDDKFHTSGMSFTQMLNPAISRYWFRATAKSLPYALDAKDPYAAIPFTRRTAANVIWIDGLFLDIDDKGATPDDVIKLLAGLKAVIYSSFNNLRDGKTWKLRAVIPFDNRCNLPDYNIRVEAFKEAFGSVTSAASWTVAQMFNLPSRERGTPGKKRSYFKVLEGDYLKWSDFPVSQEKLEEQALRLYREFNQNDEKVGGWAWGRMDIRTACEEAGMIVKKGNRTGAFDVICPNADRHTLGSGLTAGIRESNGVDGWKFHCFHSSCTAENKPNLFNHLKAALGIKRLKELTPKTGSVDSNLFNY